MNQGKNSNGHASTVAFMSASPFSKLSPHILSMLMNRPMALVMTLGANME